MLDVETFVSFFPDVVSKVNLKASGGGYSCSVSHVSPFIFLFYLNHIGNRYRHNVAVSFPPFIVGHCRFYVFSTVNFLSLLFNAISK